MCTVVERFMEEGRQQGIEEGRAEGRRQERKHLIMSCYQKGKTAEMIAEFMGIPLEEVKKIIKHCEEKEMLC